jgi:transposase
MQDGASPHKSSQHTPVFEAWSVTLLEWPGNSPDLNPIEKI